MAITTEVRADLITLVVGAFNAAPGAALLSDLVAQYNGGASVAAIAKSLGDSATFKAAYPTYLTNQEFATQMVNNIVGTRVVDSEKQWAVNTLLADLNAGGGRAEVLLSALYALRQVAANEPNWGAAAATFNNKVEVATYHTVVLGKDGTSAELTQSLSAVTNTAASVDSAKTALGGPASDDAAVTAAKTASDAANTAATAAIEAANTADAAVATAKTAADAANAKAALTDAAALAATATTAEAAATAAVTANTTAQASLTAANTALTAAIASGVQADVNTANANQIIAKYNADQAAAKVTTTAEAATTARAAADAAAADDAAATAAQTAYDAAIAASVTASADAVTAAATAATAAAAYVAAAAVTPSTDDNTAAAAAKTVADASVTAAAATGTIANAAIAEKADVATYNSAKTTFDAAEAKAAASAAAAQTAVDAAATAKAAVNSLATANAYVTAANSASTAVATAKTDAAAAATAAAALVAAAANTDSTTDDTSAAAAKTTADARVTTVAGLETTAAADVSAAALEPAKYEAKSFTLTTGIDNFTGGAGEDTFSSTGAATTLTSLDKLDGGAGNDTLNVTATAAIDTTAAVLAEVKNIETANLVSTASVTANTSGWTGLTKLTTSGVGAQTVTAATTTDVTTTSATTAATTVAVQGGKDVTVSATGLKGGGVINVGTVTAPKGAVSVTTTEDSTSTTGASAAVNVTGGTSVSVTNNLTGAVNNTITGGAVTINGSADTTSVTVTQTKAATAAAAVSGVVNGAVTIADVNKGSATADKIASVSLGNYGNSTIDSAALSTLTISGGGGTLGVNRTTSDGTADAKTLAFNVGGGTFGAITGTQMAGYTKINVTSSTAATTIASLDAAAMTALDVSGTHGVKLTTLNAAAMTSLTAGAAGVTEIGTYGTTNKLATVTVTGAGGFKSDVSGQTVLTKVDASASSGANTVTVDATKADYTGGSGVDTVTVKAAATKTISGGAGSSDVVVLQGAGATLLTAATGAKLTNFEVLDATGSSGNIDLSFISGITSLTQGAVTANVSYLNATGQSLTMTASPGFTTTYALKDATGTSDSLSVKLTSATALTGGTLTANGIETISIESDDTNTTAHVNTLTLSADAVKTLNLTGDSALTLTNTSTTLTSVDASALTGDFVWSAVGNFAAAATIKGSATKVNTVDFSAATTAVVTYTGSSGNDTVTGGSKNNVVDLGNGTNSYTGGAGNETITGGTGVDTINAGAGNDTIVGGGGADQITGGAGADKITVSGNTATIIQAPGASGTNTSTTIQTSQLTSTFDVVYGASAGLKINLGNASIVTATTTLAGTNLAANSTDNTAVFARGTYNADAGTFTYAANGADTALTYDSNVAAGVTGETIILVGYTAGSTTAAVGGVMTLG